MKCQICRTPMLPLLNDVYCPNEASHSRSYGYKVLFDGFFVLRSFRAKDVQLFTYVPTHDHIREKDAYIALRATVMYDKVAVLSESVVLLNRTQTNKHIDVFCDGAYGLTKEALISRLDTPSLQQAVVEMVGILDKTYEDYTKRQAHVTENNNV